MRKINRVGLGIATARDVPLELKRVEFPLVDMAPFLRDRGDPAALRACRELTAQFVAHDCGAVRDPRVNEHARDDVLDMVRRYFEQDDDVLVRDVRTGVDRAIGVNLSGQEEPRRWTEVLASYPAARRPYTAYLNERWAANAQARFHWAAALPEELRKMTAARRAQILGDQLVPDGFPNWMRVMNASAVQQHRTAITVAEMLEVGLELERGSLSNGLRAGNSLFAPTACELRGLELGDVIAPYHFDLGRLTVHFVASFAALICWTRERMPFQPVVPGSGFFIQAGMELEVLTGGHIRTGFHEVVILDQTLKQIAAAIGAGASTTRVGTPLFAQGGDDVLHPLGRFRTNATRAVYGRLLGVEKYGRWPTAAEWQRDELRRTNIVPA